MKSVQKKIVGLLKVLAMIVAGVLLGAILITLAYCIPVNQTNAQKSIDSLEGEGWYPSATQLKTLWIPISTVIYREYLMALRMD